MRRALTASTFFLLFGLAFCHDFKTRSIRPVSAAQQVAPAAAGIQLQPVLISGLASPIFAGNAADGTNRLFIVEQGGVIKVLQPGSSSPTVFLDISTKVMSGGEQGLLGLAFHPTYETNGRFFVDYTRKPDGATVIAEYHVSAANPNVADTTEIVHLTIPQPFANHNGGMLAFGPDGFLYIAMGDGGSGNDPGNRAQNINELLGKILRIDIDTPNGPAPYSSPPSNPFFGATPGLDEIFAVGMRNPWRFSFDRGTGDLYVGDVGQNAWEEVDIVTSGGNYGWRVFEGNHCTGNDLGLCNPANYTPPITEYAHAAGRCSITGGYVYRGALATLPTGVYLFADFCTGEIFILDGGVQSLLLDTQLNISSFGEDEAGELYVVGLGGQLYRITAAAPPPQCNSSLSPSSQNFTSNAGNGTVNVSAAPGCAWTAVSNVPWVTVTSGSSGSGIGTVGYSVASNKTSSIPRSGTATIAGLTFTVNQAAFSSSCTYSISPASLSFNAAGGTGSFQVATSGNCSWNALSSAPWIVITSASSGSDKGTLRFTVAANSGTSPRQGTIIASTQFFSIAQSGSPCGFGINPTNASFVAAGGTGNVNVTANGCGWTAVSNDSWITVTSGSSGSGNGAVAYSVAANPIAMARSGTMTIAGLTFTVNQAAAVISCTFSISPSSASFAFGGGTGSSNVTAPAGCGWTATSNDGWITITSGSSGSGNGTVNYSVGANPNTTPRSGTMTIAGETFTVNQAAAPSCTFSISPMSASVGAGGGSGSTMVTAPAGCGWTAVSNDAWITITSGSSGSGNGTVNYSVAANPASTPRSGTMTIAGQTFTVNQAATAGGCGFSISPTSKAFTSKGGTGTVTVTANATCSWTAVSNAGWITVTGGAKGTGNGTVSYSVAINTTGAPRTGVITIAGLTFTVSE